jgi:hypothetical protein
MPFWLTHSVPAFSSLLRWSIGTGSWFTLLNENEAFHGIVPVRPVLWKSRRMPIAGVGMYSRRMSAISRFTAMSS